MKKAFGSLLISGLLYCSFPAEGVSKIYLFKKDEALKNIKVKINGKEYVSNQYGEIEFRAEEGVYTLFVENQEHTIRVEGDRVTIYYVNVDEDGKVRVEVDSPVGEIIRKVEKQETVQKSEKVYSVKVKVVSFTDQKPISGAKIFIKGQPEEYITDKNGEAVLKVMAQEFSISVIHPDYNLRTLDSLQAEDQQPLLVKLTPSSYELSEFVVTAPFIEGTIAQVLAEQAKYAEVVNIIGSEQFSKAGDSDASSAVRRVSGITIMDNGYVYIRGLGGRYSITLLNNSILPSPDPTKRVVPLDIFPTGVLKNIVIKKSYSPDIPASFATGAVVLNTKEYPKEFFLDASLSVKYNTITTFKDGKFYEGGKLDFLGIEDGTRKLPIPAKDSYTFEELQRYVTSFRNNNNTKDITFPPGIGLNLAFGNSRSFRDNSLKAGYLFSLMYDNEWKKIDVERNFYNFSPDLGLYYRNGGIFSNNVNDIKLSYLLGLGIGYEDSHNIKFTSLLTRTTTNRTQIYDGTDENANVQKITNLRWQERSLFFNQLSGEHKFGTFYLDWSASISTASMDIPNEVTYIYYLDRETNRYFNNVFVFGQNLLHEYTFLEDEGNDARIDIGKKFEKVLFIKDVDIKFGFQKQSKSRSSRVLRFTYRADTSFPSGLEYENIDTIFSPENREKYFTLQNRTFFNDKYSGNLDINSTFINLEGKLSDKIRISAGGRLESLKQQVISYEQLSPTEIRSNIDITNIYPDISLKYFFSDRLQLKAAYSRTMTYPDFLEVSNSVFIDPITAERILGNPDLKASTIDNFDVRIDRQLGSLDYIAVALFYRSIKDPIEETYRPTTNVPFLSFQNALSANNYGVEFEFRKSFNFINKYEFVEKIPFFGDIDYDNLFISGNLALIESNVKLDPAQSEFLTTKERRMQGQSPYVINISFGYDNPETGLYWGVLYNTYGKRIRNVGLQGQPDAYEQPFDQLDLVVKKRWREKVTFDFKIRNILDDYYHVMQADKTVLKYKVGRTISLGMSYKF